MRVTCPVCKQRHDVAHAAIIKEANRLKEKRGGPDVDGNQASIVDRLKDRIAELERIIEDARFADETAN